MLDLALVARPALAVRLALPDAAREGAAEVVIKSQLSKETVARQPVGNAKVLEFRDLPAAPLIIELSSPLGTARESADLTSGADAAVELAVEALELRGRVYLGDEGKAAKLVFLTGAGGKVETRSDEQGDYRLTVVGLLRQATVELEGREAQAVPRIFTSAITLSGERDFHLPDTSLKVKITDAATTARSPAPACG